jgi:methyltransferase (TIGR00027 family)
MQIGPPSRTALAAALYRATHQIVDRGRVFTDPLAIRVLGMDADELHRYADASPRGHRMRAFIAARTRFAEDALQDAFARGARQLVVLGAGLDTYAYRGLLRDKLRIFEVDHPATQAWKRERLAAAGIAIPSTLTFAPIDFEHESLEDGLASACFDPKAATFFLWLGVVPYLTQAAIDSTLGFIASLAGGADVVFDYSNPSDSLNPEQRAVRAETASRVAALGEAWISQFDTDALHARLATLGFWAIEDLSPNRIAQRYFGLERSMSGEHGAHVVWARTLTPP